MRKYDPFRGAAVSFIREDSWGIYADGFKRAAELLISMFSPLTKSTPLYFRSCFYADTISN